MSGQGEDQPITLCSFFPRFFRAILGGSFSKAAALLTEALLGKWIEPFLKRLFLWQPGFVLIFVLFVIFWDMNHVRSHISFLESMYRSFTGIGFAYTVDKVDFSFTDYRIDSKKDGADNFIARHIPESISLYHYPNERFFESVSSIFSDTAADVSKHGVLLSVERRCMDFFHMNSDGETQIRINRFRSAQMDNQISAPTTAFSIKPESINIGIKASPILLQFYGSVPHIRELRNCLVVSRKEEGIVKRDARGKIGDLFLISERRFSDHVLVGILGLSAFVSLMLAQRAYYRTKDDEEISGELIEKLKIEN